MPNVKALRSAALSLALAFLISGAAPAAEPEIAPPLKRLPERERWVFRVKWLGVSVGTITASVNGVKEIAGRRAYELEVTARTNDFSSRIYPVNDRYVSYMDVERLCTLRHEVYRREGRFKKDAVTDFDQDAHRAYFRNILDGSRKTVEIPPLVQDPVSAGYYFRLLPLEPGRRVSLSLYNSEHIYRLFGAPDRMVTLCLGRLGRREAFRIQPCVEVGDDIAKKGKASGYFSRDEKRSLLAVSLRAPLFTEITGYLTEEE